MLIVDQQFCNQGLMGFFATKEVKIVYELFLVNGNIMRGKEADRYRITEPFSSYMGGLGS